MLSLQAALEEAAGWAAAAGSGWAAAAAAGLAASEGEAGEAGAEEGYMPAAERV